MYDVVIIGAGISGLVCGCYLAKAGMKVLIVEQHNKPGGYCTSFKRQGFSFDAAAHSFGSYGEKGNFRKILTDLGVDKIINVKRFGPSDVIFCQDFKIVFKNNLKDRIEEWGNIFPLEKNNIVSYYNFFDKLNSINLFENFKLKNMTFASFLSSFFSDPKLINSIAFPVAGNGGLPSSQMSAFTGIKIFNEFLIDGGYYPEGGIQELPNALAKILLQHGGTILYRTLAKKILSDGKSVSGIVLDNNETILSKYVVSACDVTQTFKDFLGNKIANIDVQNKLNAMTPSISTFILYIGIDEPFAELPQEGTNVWYLPYYDLDRIFYDVEHLAFDNIGGLMLRVSPGGKTVLAFTLAPFKTLDFWKQNKQKITSSFLDAVEKIIPNLKKHVVFLDSATPNTLYRYTLNHHGANYGWSPLHSQLFDPDFRQKTKVSGLYLTGHWTAQTHGIPGVAYLGYNAAKLVLKSETKH